MLGKTYTDSDDLPSFHSLSSKIDIYIYIYIYSLSFSGTYLRLQRIPAAK